MKMTLPSHVHQQAVRGTMQDLPCIEGHCSFLLVTLFESSHMKIHTQRRPVKPVTTITLQGAMVSHVKGLAILLR